jgi:carbon monoxide dehydrogenase subunit G
MRALTPLALHDFDDAPFRVVKSFHIDGSPAAVFAELGDPSKWFPLMKRCVWITAETGGVGAERDVTVTTFGTFRGRMLAWEPERRVAFTFVATTSPLVGQLGEDFRLSSEDGGTRLDWTMAGRTSKVGWVTQPILRGVLPAMMRRAAKSLEQLVAYSRTDRVVS